MYIYIYMCVYIYIYIYMCIYIRNVMYACTLMSKGFICIYMHNKHAPICIYVYTYVGIHEIYYHRISIYNKPSSTIVLVNIA